MKKITVILLFCTIMAARIFADANGTADELLKWKQLLDNGAITEEEYQVQKEKILNVTEVNDEKKSSKQRIEEIKVLLDSGLESNKDKIKALSKDLSFEEKQVLYSEYEKSAGGYFALNLILGCGIGSFVQGDVRSGFLSLCFELGGLLLAVNGLNNENPTLYALGYGFLIGGRVGECISPWGYASKKNNLLKSSLNLSSETISLSPVINLENTNFGLVAKINI